MNRSSLLAPFLALVVLLLPAYSHAQSEGSPGCVNGDVRLQGGNNSMVGRVEFCYNNVWGTVCNDNWDDDDASVVCSQLGFSRVGARAIDRPSLGRFDAGVGPIYLDEVRCNGDEQFLVNCTTSGVGTHNCGHFEDAGVQCEAPGFSCTEGEVQLVGGSSPYEGRVEVCVDNKISTVCDDGKFSTPEAQVVCRQLNASSDGVPIATAGGSYGTGIGGTQLNGLDCLGSEDNLTSCASNPTFLAIFCDHIDDVGVICPVPTPPCENGEIRLANGRIPSEGRIEMCYNGVWGTVCHSQWQNVDARVACGELGYPGNNSYAIGFADFGRGEGPILLSNVNCDGTEERLFDCGGNAIGNHICSHAQDAGVICEDANNTCTAGDIRLVGGATPNEGRLEVCFVNHWGTICDDDFGSTEASLVCRLLGYPEEGAIGLHNAFFGQGVGVIFVDNTDCIGNETSILDCNHLGIGISNCFHNEDVSILCQGLNSTCENGDIRLVNGTGSHNGRVEVCFNGRWGTVCDDQFGTDDAIVVCNQLGYTGEGAVALSQAYYGQGTGPIFLDDTECSPSNHTYLQECFVSEDGANIGQHNCLHSEDVSVICPIGNNSCGEYPNGGIRLVGGSVPYEGRVELCLDGEWGTLCDNSWTDLDAVVVCRQLSFGISDATARSGAFYGQGNGSIFLDSFFCSGDEEHILDCIHFPASTSTCSHAQDASVLCSATQCQHGELRLVDGEIPSEGRVEICYNGQFQAICDDLWDSRDAAVACRQLGYSPDNAIALPLAFFGSGTRGIALDDLQCIGNETTLLDCPHLSEPSFCFRFEHAGIVCQPSDPTNLTCTNGELRLSGNSQTAPWEGNLQICFSGRWGSVCQDNWDQVDAMTACRLLGYGNGSRSIPTRRGYFGFEDIPVFLDEVNCLGNETGLLECASVAALGDHDCSNFLDAGVICAVTNDTFECKHGDIRLMGGEEEYEGRVEICVNGIWGTVCDDGWGNSEAEIVCNQLGYGAKDARPVTSALYGAGTGRIFLANLLCQGNETNLLDCRAAGPGYFCLHSEDAGVRCATPGPPPCADGEVRLFGGQVPTEGTIEVCEDGLWQGGTICDDLWDNREAEVVCRQLGFNSTGAIGLRGAFFGEGSGNIVSSNFGCRGNESSLSLCSNSSGFFCTHVEDAGVICPSNMTRNCSTGDIRLMDGRNQYEGRVEVCIHGHWGTVCDDSWDGKDAAVVCRQLGYNDLGYAAAVSNARFGIGDGLIVLDDVRCEGNETTILGCRAAETGVHNCRPDEDAGVYCPAPNSACINGAIRLADGESDDQGRVEYCLGGEWGTVCADGSWDNQDAQVICRQLGYNNTQGSTSITVGGGSGPIHLSRVECLGSEDKLVDCPPPQFFFSGFTCTHSVDAGVVCSSGETVCEEGEIRLVGGVSENLGRLEICFNNVWGSVCDDQFDSKEAQVVCRQLGYTNIDQSVAIGNGYFGPGQSAIHLDELQCTGSEAELQDCVHGGVGNHNCGHFEDAGVICVVEGASCEYGELRLVGGTSEKEGRVEICVGGIWGTICNDLYDRPDARVICRQLGYNDAGSYATDISLFGQGSGLILLDDLQCIGNETQLIDCPSTDVGAHNCLHFEDIGVRCEVDFEPCNDTDVRLLNGQVSTEGTVQFCSDGAWGTICDDFWDNREARVVCRQLGYQSEGALAVRGAFFGSALGDILFSNVGCQGNESRLVDCTNGVHFCDHTEDAGVICPPTVTLNCTDGAVRLVGGDNQYEGRVEVCLHGRWGTVCDDSWDSSDATVVCRQLGYTTPGRPFALRQNTIFGGGNGFIILDEVNCNGSESTLFGCRASERGQHNCASFEDAGVLCPYEESPCVSGETILENNGTLNNVSGRVQVCVGGRWSTVCAGSTFSDTEAEVICRQLGYTDPRGAIFATATGPNALFTSPVLIREPVCTGSEEHIFDCSLSEFPDFFCDLHVSDAAVFCSVPLSDCEDGDVRLVNGTVANEGRVEICFNRRWGTICDDSWGFEEAEVTCRQLGYNSSLQESIPFPQAYFGGGLTSIHLDDMNCFGNESRLNNCRHSGVGNHNCAHNEDAGVLCIANNPVCTHGDLRLVGGSSTQEGRVEICVGGRWGTICNDGWDTTDASVVCRQLGFSPDGAIATDAFLSFGVGTGPIFVDDLGCTGAETRLLDCPSSGLGRHNCFHNEDIAVSCNRTVTPSPFCQRGDLRLFGGETENEGTLEICLNQAWGTVCDDLYDNNDAKVACRKLGFQSEGAVGVRGGFFGRGSGPIHVANLRCTGNESSLFDCPHNKNPFCFHFEDSGVICPPRVPYNCTTGDLRLADGDNQYEGRVEMCLHGRWGTICDDSWDNREADVVCRQLGYTQNGVGFAVQSAAFGSGEGFIVLDEVQCVGNESTLISCRASEIGAHNCLPSEDAGVICPYAGSVCRNGDIRLVGSEEEFEGRVEICIGGDWGTICEDSFWDDRDAQVICRQVGYSKPSEALATSARAQEYGLGTGPISLNGLNCSGNESRITDCQVLNSGFLRFCDHTQDVAVICKASNLTLCVDGDVRLVDGQVENEGRVEVCARSNWGTVCDDDWDTLDATVVCRQLGYNSSLGAIPVPKGFFGTGIGRIHLDDLQCNGTEERLVNCGHRGTGVHNCGHAEDAGVICLIPNPRCEHGMIRLAGGTTTEYEGRVEICLGGTWGSVCDDSWDAVDASVVCRELGFSASGAVAVRNAFFGQGVGPIFIDDTQCTGNETSLYECPSSGIGVHNCQHFEDAGVRCQPIPCSDGTVRLSGGLSDYNGRVEICVGGTFGEVCASSVGISEAMSICSNLGVQATPSNTIITQAGLFKQSEKALPAYNVTATCDNGVCSFSNSTENSQCTAAEMRVGLFCQNRMVGVNVTCIDGDIQLAGGSNPSEGRLEVCLNNQWGTVCDDSMDQTGAGVVCNQLGYSSEDAVAVLGGNTYGVGNGPILLDNVKCSGQEMHILSCPQLPLGVPHDCTHSEDVGVKCFSGSVCDDGDVRLIGGRSDAAGRVEICYNNQWGTICDSEWDDSEAVVVCRQLNYNDGQGAVVTPRGFFGSGSGQQMSAGSLNCQRSESSIDQCSQSGAGNGTCQQTEVAGVICGTSVSPDCTHGELRLLGGSSELEGRVEICLGGQWGSLCANSWTVQEASVVCGQLGYQSNDAVPTTVARGDAPSLMGNTQCTGEETKLLQCRSSGIGAAINCLSSQQAGVVCKAHCKQGSVRLAGGVSDFNGRVEVCVDGTWGAVCGNNFGTTEAEAVCSSLGYETTNVITSLGQIFQDSIDEAQPMFNIASSCTEGVCTFTPTSATCSLKTGTVGVFCPRKFTSSETKVCDSGDIKLVGGSDSSEGRLEVCLNNKWGTVCDDSWDDKASTVVCRQLGLDTKGAMSVSPSAYGKATVDIFLDDLACTGDETNIFGCSQRQLATPPNCLHTEDVAVQCTGEEPITTKEPAKGPGALSSGESTGQLAAILVPLILIIVLLILIIVAIVVIVLVYRARKTGKLSFRNYDDEVPIAHSSSFSADVDTKEDIPLEEKL